MIFRDRDQAARLLEEKLSDFRGQKPLVLGVPRGAVPMARIIADALDGELDIILVHKFSLPDQPEYAMGAVSEDGDVYLGIGAERMKLDESQVADAAAHEIDRLQAKRRLFTPKKTDKVDVRGRVVILVDDGIATGATMIAAVRSVKDGGAGRVIVASPVVSSQAVARIEMEGAEVRSVLVPENFFAVSQFYEDFEQVEDYEVVQVLTGSRPEISIRQDGLELKGLLVVPDLPKGIVVFAHGSGSGRHSPRNQFVARILQRAGFATLLADLISESESETRERVFDIDFLSRRLLTIIHWVKEDPQLMRLPLCLFGASTGAAAAIKSAMKMNEGEVSAIVSRGGRPDLAWECLPLMVAPSLLIVGELDQPVLAQTREAFMQMNCEKDLVVIPGAGHLFEEPGALEKVAVAAETWFSKHLAAISRRQERQRPRV